MINSVSADPVLPNPVQDVPQVNRVFNQQPYQGPRQSNFRGRGQFRGPYPNTHNQPRYRLPQQNAQPRPHCQSCFSLGKRLSIRVDASHNQQQCPQLLQIQSVQQEEQKNTTEDPAETHANDGNNLYSEIRLIAQRFESQSILK